MVSLMILTFVGFTLYNLRGIRDLEIRVKIGPVYNIILILAGILYIYMAYRLKKEYASFILCLAAEAYLITTVYAQGIGKDGIYVFQGSSLIRKLERKDIKKIKIDRQKNKIEIYADSTIYKQDYDDKDFKKVLGLIEEFK